MQHRFENIVLPRKTPGGPPSQYRVYSDANNFKLVEAQNAAEALKASGLTEAVRIERYTPTLQAVLESQIFSEVAATPPAAAAAAATAAAPAAETPEPETQKAETQKPADAPLSSDDVSKLLQENP